MADVIRENAPVIAITHVTLIDGTGAPARTDQSIVIREGKIEAVGANEKVTLPAGAKVIDGTGHTLIPGWWVCMSICFIRGRLCVLRFCRAAFFVPTAIFGERRHNSTDDGFG
jgi:hypothetical protein